LIADLSGRERGPGRLFGLLVVLAVLAGIVLAAWLFGLFA